MAYMESLRAAPPEWMAGVLQSNYDCGANADSVTIPEDMNACEVQGGTIGNPVPVLEITPEELQHWQVQQVPLYLVSHHCLSQRGPLLFRRGHADQGRGDRGLFPLGRDAGLE